MAQVPKYVETLLLRRRKLASSLMDVCCELDQYCKRIGLDTADADTMIYGKPLSYDMVRGLIEKAKHLHCYPLNIREELLMMACAVFRKYENDKARKEVWSMALEKEKRDRSYQFGRLLAIYEKIERDTYGDNEKREPQAIRLQTAYIDRPMRTAMILQRSVGYYLEKQRFPGIRQWYRDMIDQIMAIISEFPENELDKRLEGSYLLGYSLQRIELTSRKRKQTNY